MKKLDVNMIDHLIFLKKIKDSGETPEVTNYNLGERTYTVIDTSGYKVVIGPDYNFDFDKKTGYFQRWGKTPSDDPSFSPIGPELLDCEISVNGCSMGCPFCYKGNTNGEPKNMSLESFKRLLDLMPKTLTQVAFGITDIQTNPDFIPMMEYCREKGIIPNFTLTGIDLTDEMAKKCLELIGAVAVSAYETDKNVCYDTVKKFTDLGMEQTNIHLMVSEETLPFVYEVLDDVQNDERLKKLNAVVFLGLKPKGRATKGSFNPLSSKKFEELMKWCLEKNLNIGFDSCSAPKFESVVNSLDLEDKVRNHLLQCSESCESSLFSAYVNTDSEYWHCSFAEEEDGQEAIDVSKAEDFFKDVWYSDAVKSFRKQSLDTCVNGCRSCTIFPSINL